MIETNPNEVTEDIGGVQGSEPNEAAATTLPGTPDDEATDVPVPDAGDIEWAGAVVGKAPRAG